VGKGRAISDVYFGDGVVQIGAFADSDFHQGEAGAAGETDAVARMEGGGASGRVGGDADQLQNAGIQTHGNVESGAIFRKHRIQRHQWLAVGTGKAPNSGWSAKREKSTNSGLSDKSCGSGHRQKRDECQASVGAPAMRYSRPVG